MLMKCGGWGVKIWMLFLPHPSPHPTMRVPAIDTLRVLVNDLTPFCQSCIIVHVEHPQGTEILGGTALSKNRSRQQCLKSCIRIVLLIIVLETKFTYDLHMISIFNCIPCYTLIGT